MTGFIKIKYGKGTELWVDADKIIALDEVNRKLYVETETGVMIYLLTEKSTKLVFKSLISSGEWEQCDEYEFRGVIDSDNL